MTLSNKFKIPSFLFVTFSASSSFIVLNYSNVEFLITDPLPFGWGEKSSRYPLVSSENVPTSLAAEKLEVVIFCFYFEQISPEFSLISPRPDSTRTVMREKVRER